MRETREEVFAEVNYIPFFFKENVYNLNKRTRPTKPLYLHAGTVILLISYLDDLDLDLDLDTEISNELLIDLVLIKSIDRVVNIDVDYKCLSEHHVITFETFRIKPSKTNEL